MIFLLNDKIINLEVSAGETVLDFIRYDQHLKGTKIGCREGDCGACTILVGGLENGNLHYRSMTSCLMPLANAVGKHIVTIEGLNLSELSPVQEAIVEEGGTQCGFCTVGFVVSLTGHCIKEEHSTMQKAVASIDGNICRCTGYKSLERAALKISRKLREKNKGNGMKWLVDNHFLPSYFLTIKDRLTEISASPVKQAASNGQGIILGGGTDLYVQQPEKMPFEGISPVFDQQSMKGIQLTDDMVSIGASASAEELKESEVMNDLFPGLQAYIKLVSSTPIRNMGTLAGNLVNASPIGDLSIFFLALDSSLTLNSNGGKRLIKLKAFFRGYKELDLGKGELVESLHFKVPGNGTLFNFEKVCKRTHLDIASVNSACSIKHENGVITNAHLSTGGVAPVPKYLEMASRALEGQKLSPKLLKDVHKVIQSEISPISDARGSAEYKRLLLRQLFYAHFIKWFPKDITMKDLKDE